MAFISYMLNSDGFFICNSISTRAFFTYECLMSDDIISIMEMCRATGNRHLLWFEKLLGNHFEGIIAHATYDISAAKIEGINNKIKTLRRQGYGYPDDECFFLKLFDMSGKPYIRNPKSHKKSD